MTDYKEELYTTVTSAVLIVLVYISDAYNNLKLVSAIFYQIFILSLNVALQKFISSKKLFLFSRYSIFCNFFPSFPHFPGSK